MKRVIINHFSLIKTFFAVIFLYVALATATELVHIRGKFFFAFLFPEALMFYSDVCIVLNKILGMVDGWLKL